MGRRFVWRPGAEVEVREAPFELLETSDFLDSTIARVYLTADPVRRRLAIPHPVLDFPIFSELRAEGVTDYFAAPLVFTDARFMWRRGRPASPEVSPMSRSPVSKQL
jgi:adenylate cyclase